MSSQGTTRAIFLSCRHWCLGVAVQNHCLDFFPFFLTVPFITSFLSFWFLHTDGDLI